MHYKKSPANAKVNVQQRCMLERPVKQNLRSAILTNMFLLQSPEGAKRPVANYLKSRIFPTPLSFSALDRGDPFQIYGKALPILKLESSRQPTVNIW